VTGNCCVQDGFGKWFALIRTKVQHAAKISGTQRRETKMTTIGTAAPMGKMIAIFLGALLFGNILLFAISYFFPDIEMPGSIGIIFLLVGAMSAGGAFAHATKRRMTTGEKFRFAVVATVLAILLSLAVVWGMFAYYGVPFSVQTMIMAMAGEAVSEAEIRQMLPIIGAVALVVGVLVCFFGVGAGASGQVKQLEKAAKGR
jgi:hypothetical protein